MIKKAEIDNRRGFDWGRASRDYAREIYGSALRCHKRPEETIEGIKINANKNTDR